MLKDFTIILCCLMMMLGNVPVWAHNASNFNLTDNNEDVILLNNGHYLKGEIIKFKSNSVKLKTNEEILKIKNKDISLIAVSQELTGPEKYRLGFLDGQRYAENKTGNFFIGFWFGILGSAAVYLTSEQLPSYEAAELGENKVIINDYNYLSGYEEGAKKESGKQALIGTIVSGVVLLAAIISVASDIADEDDLYYY